MSPTINSPNERPLYKTFLGGWNEKLGANQYVYVLNGQGQFMRHPQGLIQARSGHTSIVKGLVNESYPFSPNFKPKIT